MLMAAILHRTGKCKKLLVEEESVYYKIIWTNSASPHPRSLPRVGAGICQVTGAVQQCQVFLDPEFTANEMTFCKEPGS